MVDNSAGGDLQQFENALEENGIEVDSILPTADVSLMYTHDPDEWKQQVATIALVYAKVPQITMTKLSVTSLTSTSRNASRVANFMVERSLANRYNSGDVSKKEYVEEVLSTWVEY